MKHGTALGRKLLEADATGVRNTLAEREVSLSVEPVTRADSGVTRRRVRTSTEIQSELRWHAADEEEQAQRKAERKAAKAAARAAGEAASHAQVANGVARAASDVSKADAKAARKAQKREAAAAGGGAAEAKPKKASKRAKIK